MNFNNNTKNYPFNMNPTPSEKLDQQGKLADSKFPITDTDLLVMTQKYYETAIPIIGRLQIDETIQEAWGHLVSPLTRFSEFRTTISDYHSPSIFTGKVNFVNGDFVFNTDEKRSTTESCSGVQWASVVLNYELRKKIRETREGVAISDEETKERLVMVIKAYQEKTILTGFLNNPDELFYKPGYLFLSPSNKIVFITYPGDKSIKEHHGNVFQFDGRLYFVETSAEEKFKVSPTDEKSDSIEEEKKSEERVFKSSDNDLKKVAAVSQQKTSTTARDGDILSWAMTQECSLFASEETLRLLRTTKSVIRGLTFNKGKVLGTIGEMTDGGFVVFSFVKDNSVSYVEGRVILTEKLGPVFFEQQANMNYMATSYVGRGAKVSAIIDGVSYDYNGQEAEALVAHLRRIGAV